MEDFVTSTIADGDCLCGNYHYQFDRDQVISAHHCHCKDCQTMTGSGKATIIMVPTAVLETRGGLKTYTVTGTDGGHVTRGFCPECGSQLISFLELFRRTLGAGIGRLPGIREKSRLITGHCPGLPKYALHPVPCCSAPAIP